MPLTAPGDDLEIRRIALAALLERHQPTGIEHLTRAASQPELRGFALELLVKTQSLDALAFFLNSAPTDPDTFVDYARATFQMRDVHPEAVESKLRSLAQQAPLELRGTIEDLAHFRYDPALRADPARAGSSARSSAVIPAPCRWAA